MDFAGTGSSAMNLFVRAINSSEMTRNAAFRSTL